jgi:hypothetical protein
MQLHPMLTSHDHRTGRRQMMDSGLVAPPSRSLEDRNGTRAQTLFTSAAVELLISAWYTRIYVERASRSAKSPPITLRVSRITSI